MVIGRDRGGVPPPITPFLFLRHGSISATHESPVASY